MESWFLLALVAPAIYTVVNFIDKYVVEHKVKDYRGIPIYGAVVGLFTGCAIWLISGFQLLPALDATIVLSTGALTLFGYALYFNALSKSETSYVIGLLQLTPVFTLIISYFIIGEAISAQQLVGFTLILAAVIALSVKKEREKFKFNQAFYFIIIANVFFAFSSVLIKLAINANSFTEILIFESWGIALGGLILFVSMPSVRNAFIKTTREVGGKVLSIMFVNEFIFIISKVITFLAISLGPVALVSVLSGTQVFYGVIYGLALTAIAPKLFNEERDTKILFKKFLLMSVLFFGILLLS